MNNKVLFLILLLFVQSNLFAQKDTLSHTNDSLNSSLIKNFSADLAANDAQSLADSIHKAALEAEISKLKTTDNLKKEELLAQIASIKQKENDRSLLKKAKIDSLRSTAIGYPVLGFFKDTLFLLYSKTGSFSVQERAAIISTRIQNLGSNFRFTADSLLIITSDPYLDIIFKDQTIMSISENDAIWNNTSSDSLAVLYKNTIADAVSKYKSETSIQTLAKEAGIALLVIAFTGFLIFYIIKLFRWSAQKIEEQEGGKIKGIKIKDYVLFDEKRQVKVLININTALKWFVILIAVYVALPVLFGIFPWTQNFAQTLFGYILTPLKNILYSFANFLPNLITIVVIIFVFRYVLKGVYFLKEEIEKGHLKLSGFYPDWANPTYQLVRVIIFAFMIVVIFPYLPGSDSPIFKGVSVFLGFLFTFGSAGSLSNIVAGLVLTYMRLFKIGDRVKIGDVTGDVIEKSMLVTRVRTIKNEIISIPNSTVMSSHTINYSSDAPEKGLIIHSTVTIGYDVPWKGMQQALIDAADRTDLILKEPKPFVLQTGLEDFYVSYQINAYIREANKQAIIYSALHANIQDVCNERGIEILSPHYRAARDGNNTTIPSSYLAKDYEAPSFKINIKKDAE